MSSKLEMMRKTLNERNNKKVGFDNTIYPFWNMDTDKFVQLGLLPWEDEVSGGFWTEKKVIPMTFVDPNNPNKTLVFKAPCMEMYSNTEKCAVLRHVRDLYKEAETAQRQGDTSSAAQLKTIANAHWLSVTFFYQGFVFDSPFAEENVPENPIRAFSFQKKLHKQLYDSVTSTVDPFDHLPTGEFTVEQIRDIVNGGEVPDDVKLSQRRLILGKGKQGEHAEWNTKTKWHSKWEPLTDMMMKAIAQYGFHDLRARLPTRPTPEQVEVLEIMIDTSINRSLGLDEGLWNPEWEDVGFKPFTNNREQSSSDGDKPAYRRVNTNGAPAPKPSAPTESAKSVMDKVSLSRGAKPKDEPKVEETQSAEDGGTEAPVETKTETPVVENEKPANKASGILARLKDKNKAAA